jgi:hypothetical protein
MTALDALLHILNFVLPAVFVGGALALGRWRKNTGYRKSALRRTWLLNSLAGGAALAIGLILFGVDGKMLSYALLVLACSLSQLWQSRKN